MTQPFKVCLLDSPWKMADKLPGPGRGAEKHYECMKTEDLCKIQMPDMAADSLMFMWRVAAMQEDALTVMHMLGYTPKSEIVWVKTPLAAPESATDLTMGMGRYVRHSHEVCLIGSKGRGASLVKNHALRSVFFAPRTKHSRKPDEFYDIVEALVGGEGPFIELFARHKRAGWVQWGDAVGVHIETDIANAG